MLSILIFYCSHIGAICKIKIKIDFINAWIIFIFYSITAMNSNSNNINIEAKIDTNSVDSWGCVTKDNLSQMIDRTNKYKEPLMKMAIMIRDLVDEYDKTNNIVTNMFIIDGTLLGAYRDGKMIDHDYDFDYGLYGSDKELLNLYKFLDIKIQEINRKNNKNYIINCVNTYAHKLEIFDKDYGKYDPSFDTSSSLDWYNVMIDIQLMSDKKDTCYVELQYFRNNLNEKIIHTKKSLLPMSTINFEGYVFKAPHDPKEFLVNNYGCIEKGAVFDPVSGKYVKINE